MKDEDVIARKTPWKRWASIAGAVALMALLSAAQIYLRQRAAGESPSWMWAAVTNLLAWAPWALMTPVIFRLGRLVPLVSAPRSRSAAFHLAAAAAMAAGYLVYLTVFWFVFFPDIVGELTAAAFPRVYGDAMGEHFLVAFTGYWLVLVIGFGIDVYARYRAALSENGDQVAVAELEEPQRLEIRSRGRVRYVDVDEVDWVEAAGSYVKLHLGERSVLERRTLTGLAEELGDRFVRVHRSALVRPDRVVELRPLSHGEARIRLTTGKELKVSRNYRKQVEALLRGAERT